MTATSCCAPCSPSPGAPVLCCFCGETEVVELFEIWEHEFMWETFPHIGCIWLIRMHGAQQSGAQWPGLTCGGATPRRRSAPARPVPIRPVRIYENLHRSADVSSSLEGLLLPGTHLNGRCPQRDAKTPVINTLGLLPAGGEPISGQGPTWVKRTPFPTLARWSDPNRQVGVRK